VRRPFESEGVTAAHLAPTRFRVVGTFLLRRWPTGAEAPAGRSLDAARYVLAPGWFGHGVWDLVHLRGDAVVSRSDAAWCGVLDMLVAAELVLGRQ
jgi:hypothetical protein